MATLLRMDNRKIKYNLKLLCSAMRRFNCFDCEGEAINFDMHMYNETAAVFFLFLKIMPSENTKEKRETCC